MCYQSRNRTVTFKINKMIFIAPVQCLLESWERISLPKCKVSAIA